jgi:hypothetical protein
MASIAARRTTIANERLFFLIMALAIATTVVAGFGLDLALRVSFADYPWQVHAHALVFGSWIVLYVVQNWLVVDGNVALHRRLGILGAGLAATMVVLGNAVTLMAIARGGTPHFFTPAILLVLDCVGITLFGVLVAAGIAMRRDAAWHKRLMLCASILVMSPALGRVLPMPLLGPVGPFAVYASMMLYVVAGMGFDLATRRRIHPAYFVGAGVITLMQVSVGILAFSPPVMAFANHLAGT